MTKMNTNSAESVFVRNAIREAQSAINERRELPYVNGLQAEITQICAIYETEEGEVKPDHGMSHTNLMMLKHRTVELTVRRNATIWLAQKTYAKTGRNSLSRNLKKLYNDLTENYAVKPV